MGNSTSSDNPVSESIGFKSRLYSLNCEKSCSRDEDDLCNNAEKNAKEMFLEDLDGSASEEGEDLDGSVSEEGEDLDDSTVLELGSSLCKTLHIHDDSGPLCSRNPTLNHESLCSHLEVDPHSSGTDLLEGSNKAVTILFLELLQSDLSNCDTADRLSCTTAESESFSESENLAFMQPLPTTRQLISSLKGSRAQHGIHLIAKLTVEWAPEVYDPPITSASLTVKRHHRHQHHHQHNHHHAKTRKDYSNKRHSDGKLGRGAVTERKHAYRRSTGSTPPDSRNLRLQALGCNVPLLNTCGESKIESLDMAADSYETIKYESSCYMESHSPLQLPAAKASLLEF